MPYKTQLHIPFRINEVITNKIDSQGLPRTWVSDKSKINYKSLHDKLRRDGAKAYDLLILAKVLNIDLNELRDKIEL